MQLVDEEDDVFVATDFVHHGFDALFELAAVFGAGDHEGEVEGDDAFFPEDFGDIADGDFLGQAFDDGGFADTGFTDEDGIVFGAAAEDLDDAGDFIRATDNGIEFAFLGEFGEVAAEGAEGRGFAFFLGAGLTAGVFFIATVAAAFFVLVLVFILAGEVGVEFFEDFVASLVEIDVEVAEDLSGDAFTFTEETEEDVFGADVGVVEGLGFLGGEGEHLLHAGGVGDVADHFGLGSGADLLFHLHADGFEIETEFVEDIDGDALAEFDQAEQDVFGADVVVVETIRLFAGEGEDLLGAWGKVIHH